MILEAETLAKFGYSALELSYGSQKLVVCRCDSCNEVRDAHRRSASNLCRRCAIKKSFAEGSHGTMLRQQTKKHYGNCVICGKAISRKNKKYCSMQCWHQDTYEDYISRWLANQDNGLQSNNITVSSQIKRYILNRDLNQCVLCGWHEINSVTKKSPLHLDHIDGDYRNNRPENLRILCPNCHSLTENYGSLNNGHGRPRYIRIRRDQNIGK